MTIETPTRRSPQAMPSTTRRAVTAMYAGLALSVIAMLTVFVDQVAVHSLSNHLRDVYAGYVPMQSLDTSVIPTYLYIVGALGIISWLWMIWAVKRQKRWARAVATAMFILGSGVALINLVVQEYGRTLLTTPLGVVGVLPCVAGLVAIASLWRRERASALQH